MTKSKALTWLFLGPMLAVGTPAFAGPAELAKLFEMPMTELILRDTLAGRDLTQRLIGHPLSESKDREALLRALQDDAETLTARRLEERLSYLRENLDLSISLDPAAEIRRAGELEIAFVESAPETASYSASSERFLQARTFSVRITELSTGTLSQKLKHAFFWTRIQPLNVANATTFVEAVAECTASLRDLAAESAWKGLLERDRLAATANELASDLRSFRRGIRSKTLSPEVLERLGQASNELREAFRTLGIQVDFGPL